MRRRWLFLAAAAALAVPADAVAHGGFAQVAAVTVCGRTCRPLLPPLELFHSGRWPPHAIPARPAPPGPYYRVDLAWSRPPPAFFVPATGTLRSFPDPFGVSDPTWLRLAPRVEARLRAALAGLEPLPAPTITRATVDDRRVENPQAYLGLYRTLPEARRTVAPEGDVIQLFSDDLNPWADGYNSLKTGGTGVLERDGDVVALPPDLVQLVRRPDFAEEKRTWSAATAAAAAAAALALALCLGVAVVRRFNAATARVTARACTRRLRARPRRSARR
jgi:hypothetical protein